MSAARSRPKRREEYDEETRQRLIETAGEVIGNHGYAGCSIQRVTAAVGIAYGSFYRYFKSRQDLFEQLLPSLGDRMSNHVSTAIRGSPNVLELEKAAFTANYAYLIAHPYMHRLVSEAEQHAPRAYQEYQNRTALIYARSIKRSLPESASARHEISDLTVLANLLIAARTALFMKYGIAGNKINPLPKHVIKTYFDFIKDGLGHLA